MKACTNADVFGFGQAEQHRPEGHGVRVHGSPWGASRVTPNDVSVAAIHEEVDTADGRTIVVRDSWDALGHDGFHIDTDKGPDDVGVHEGVDGERQVLLQHVGCLHGFPRSRGEAELRTFFAQLSLVVPQGFTEEEATLPRIFARLKSTDGASLLPDRQGKDRGSVLPDRRSVRSGAARLRSTSECRFHPILVPEVIAVVIEELLERVRGAIARNAALLCAHANRGAATEGDGKWTVGDGNWSPSI